MTYTRGVISELGQTDGRAGLVGQKFASGHIKFKILIRYTHGNKIKGL